MRLLLAFIFLFSQTTFGQTVGKNIEFNSVTGADYLTNYVISPDARKNASNTTTSSATVTRDTTAANQINGVASYSVDTSATSGYVEFTLGTVYEPAISGNCEFKGVFKGDGTLYSAQIVDGSGNLLNSAALTNETNYRPFSIVYPCAASGSRKVRITQTTAGTSPAINVGKLYYGQITNLQAGVPNNVFSATVFATGVVTGENEDFINGNASVTDTSLFAFTWNTNKFTVAPVCNATPVVASATTSPTIKFEVASTTSGISVRTYESTTAAKTAYAFYLTCTRASTDFIQPAITAPNYDTDFGSYTPTITTGTGTMTNYTATGFWRRIGDSIELTVSLTFSGAAGTWTIPDISLPNGLTIATSKGVSTTSNDVLGTASFIDAGVQNYPPGYVIAPSTSTLRVYTSYTATHAGNAPLLSTQATSTFPFSFGSGDYITIRTFPIPVTGWTTSQRAPQLLGSVTSNAASALREEYLAIESDCTTATCTIARQSGAFTSVTRSSTGLYVINYPSGTWSSFPECNFNTNNHESYFAAYPSSTSFSLQERDSAGTGVDGGMHVRCIGPR